MTTVVLSVFATLLGPLGALQSASAADDPPAPGDVVWRSSSEPAEAARGYAGMVNTIRTSMGGGRLRPDHNAPFVDVTDIDGTSDFLTIDMHAEDRPEFIRVFMRRSDAYVMGWRPGVEDGAGDLDFGNSQFYTLEPGVVLPGSTPTGVDANVNSGYQNLGTYTNLAQQGATRDGMTISAGQLENAVLTLTDTGDSTTRAVAQSILQIIVGVAEGTRFRDQARGTARALSQGVAYTISSQDRALQNSWATISAALLAVVLGGAGGAAVATATAGGILLASPVVIGAITYTTAAALQAVLMLAYHSNLTDSKRRNLDSVAGATPAADDTLAYVEPDPFGDYPTIQDAVNAAPSDGVSRVLTLAKGTYNEAVVIPASKSNLFITHEAGATPADVVITADRAHGMINPATGLAYGTEGSAVLTVKATGVTVGGITIQNTFDPANHPEIDQYSTQAVAVAAEGDRETFAQDRIIARQDTVLAKAPVATGQYRQYFVGSYIEGSIDFIFGNATAVFDECNIAMRNWVGGTVLAPNTDQSQKYGFLISQSEIFTNGVPDHTMYLGRPWHNTATASPQAVVRDSTIHSGISSAHPWTDMTTDYSWSQARFKQYNNSGPGAGDRGANDPEMTVSEATDYTAEKYLAGTDGWDPVYH